MGHLRSSSVVVACVIGFHEGTYSTSDKVKSVNLRLQHLNQSSQIRSLRKHREASEAVEFGAAELDMVLNYAHLKDRRYAEVYTDISAVRNVAPHPIVLKVILETSQLSHHEIIAGCKIADAAGADYVKTSTGFNGPGATEHNVRLMKTVVGEKVKVKASGGVKTVSDCVTMMEAGAERIGTSNGVLIVEEAQRLVDNITHYAGEESERSQKQAPSVTRMSSNSESEKKEY